MELESYVQMLVFQEQKLIESTFSLMGHNTRSAQRGTFARLMAFQKFGLRCGSSLGTRQKCRAESRTQLLV